MQFNKRSAQIIGENSWRNRASNGETGHKKDVHSCIKKIRQREACLAAYVLKSLSISNTSLKQIVKSPHDNEKNLFELYVQLFTTKEWNEGYIRKFGFDNPTKV